MARPKGFKEGGGRLNGSDGTILAYEFTTEHPFATGERKSSSDFKPLYAVLTIQEDGKDDVTTDVRLVGDATHYTISKEGASLTPIATDGRVWQISGASEWGQFIKSLVEAGFPEKDTELFYSDSEDDELNYETIQDQRCRFGQVEQFDKNGKPKTYVGNDGKERNRTSTIVTAFYGPAEAPSKPKGARSVAGATKTSASRTNGSGKPAKSAVSDVAVTALKQVLEAQGGSMPKSKLSMALLRLFDKKHPQKDLRDEVKAYLFDDNNLSAIDGVLYDRTSKDQTIELEG